MAALSVVPQAGILRVATPGAVTTAIAQQDEMKAKAASPAAEELSDLSGLIRTKYEVFRRHRDTANGGWTDRLIYAMRCFNGVYDAQKLQEIAKFGGSQVYARVIAMKCRGASSLLRDVYLGADRPWGLGPAADPDIPPQILSAVEELVQVEIQTMQASGQAPDINAIRDRTMGLIMAARQAAKKKASDQAKVAEEKIDEILVEGNFYKALAEFIVDLPLFPFACIKGPVVRIVPTVSWANGSASVDQKPRLFWTRVSPFDLYWTPGAADIEDADVIERTRVTRADLNDLLDLPGYNTNAIKSVLEDYGIGGLVDNWDASDAERAELENRENPQYNQSGLISCLEFHGNVQGKILKEYGLTKKDGVEDDIRDYHVQAWMIGRYIIKCQLSPSPRKRHPYFVTSFEKVPGTPVGNALPDILADIQEVCNAALRSLVNNLSISSGPQVVVNDDRLAPDEDGDELYPWKRWHVRGDPLASGGAGEKPVDFFQPNSNSQELLGVYDKFNAIADDLSAIPRYLAGGSSPGGAGRTASGLAMLMGNASKILQTVAANIDRDVLDPLLHQLFDMLMLTDQSGLLTGSEEIRVMGVNVALQRETQRSRQLELLQLTANPIDAPIMGIKGRAALLRSVSNTVGLDGEQIVPSDDEIEAQQKAAAQQAAIQPPPDAAEAGAQAQGGQQPPASTGDMGPRTNLQQQKPVSGGVH